MMEAYHDVLRLLSTELSGRCMDSEEDRRETARCLVRLMASREAEAWSEGYQEACRAPRGTEAGRDGLRPAYP